MRVTPARLVRVVSFILFTAILFIFILYENLISDTGVNTRDSSSPGFKLIDWEDYEFEHREKLRRGPGEQGLPVFLSEEQKQIASKTINQNGFSIYVSEKIAVDRAIKDIRHPKCKGIQYSSILPTVSVIIPFYEEHWETLIRTFVSVLNRAPEKLIKEVILVDDGSTRSYLKEKLDQYLEKQYPDRKVRVIHLPQREGLIRARLAGANSATGDVLIFLDSHCEAGVNWLPPLLDPIAKDYKTVVCPFIDVIDATNFEYRAQDEGARGAFDWEFYYKRLPRLPDDRFHPEKPFDSPVMAGGLFAISRNWFWELGGYDRGLQIWGGEQYELSFKIWMCGGRMIDTPCSRIGHIYRKYSTNFPNPGIGDFVGRNYKRVAEVWMDEYKEYLYKRRPHYRKLDPGNLTEQYQLRKRLQCKSFDWFMKEIAFDLTKKYPLIDPISFAVGEIRSIVDVTLCIDALNSNEQKPIELKKCVKDFPVLQGVQRFEFTYRQDIRSEKETSCFDIPNSQQQLVFMYPCHEQGGNQHWRVVPNSNHKSNPVSIIHTSTKLCLEAIPSKGMIVASQCDPSAAAQNWHWETLQIDESLESIKRAGL